MKKILLIFLIFTFLNLFSQEYTPLLKEGNKWSITFRDGGIQPMCLFPMNYVNYYYTIGDETTVNGKLYRKIICEFSSNSLQHIRFCGDNLQGNIAALLREDISEKKVYQYNAENNTESVLYDFSAQIGDQVPNNGAGMIISDIGIGNVFNKNVKYFQISQYFYIYEGIGTANGLLENLHSPSFEQGNWLNCFENISGISCNSQLVLATSENTVNKTLTLYYSKETQDFKVLSSDSKNYIIKFYDTSGKFIEEIKSKGNQNFVLKNNIKAKMLFYTISDEKSSWKGKIIIP